MGLRMIPYDNRDNERILSNQIFCLAIEFSKVHWSSISNYVLHWNAIPPLNMSKIIDIGIPVEE